MKQNIDLSNFNNNNFALYNKDYNRTNKISTSKVKKPITIQAKENLKFSRYNSADKYKLSNYKNKLNINKFDEILGKGGNKVNYGNYLKDKPKVNSKGMYFYPHQINININNYNFSSYNNKSNQKLIPSSNALSSQQIGNIIQNNSNSPAYIEILNPLPDKTKESFGSNIVSTGGHNINSFNRSANRNPKSFKNEIVNYNINNLHESVNIKDDKQQQSSIVNFNQSNTKPVYLTNSSKQLPMTKQSSRKVIINKNLQKKIIEINSNSQLEKKDKEKIFKIGNLEVEDENESFFHEVINLFEESNKEKNRDERYPIDKIDNKTKNQVIQMPIIQQKSKTNNALNNNFTDIKKSNSKMLSSNQLPKTTVIEIIEKKTKFDNQNVSNIRYLIINNQRLFFLILT